MKRIAAALFVGIALLGCGIGASENVEELRPEDLAALNQTSTTSTAVAETVPPEDTTPGSVEPTTTLVGGPTTTVPTADVTLYFVNGSQLVPVQIPLPVGVRERGILDGLAAGPPPREFEEGVRSVVPVELVRRTRRTGDRITVDFNGESFRGVESDDQRLMVAQIVVTLTKLPAIREVLFTIDGEPMRVYQRNDELTEPGEPVTLEDYEELVASAARTAT